MARDGRDEKEEKEVQKRDEKEEEKRDEKSLDEKYHRDPVGIVVLAAVLVWVGAVFLAREFGAFVPWEGRGLTARGHEFQANTWAVLFLGLGVITLVEIAVRLSVPAYRKSVVGSFVWAAIMIGVGLGFGFGLWSVIVPLVLIAIGLAVLLGGLARKS